MNPKRRNRRMGTSAVLTCLLVGGAGVSSQAHAQAWLPDRAYTEGPGIRAGDLEVHPGVAVRGGYDTNVFRADGKTRTLPGGQDVTQKRQGAAILAVTPHLHLSTLSEQRRTQGEDRQGAERQLPPVAFRGGVAATYFHYFLDNAPKNLEVDTDLWLGILPQRPFNIDLSVAYIRNVRPFTQNAFYKNAYNFDLVRPRARVNFGSRSRVLTAYVGYAPQVILYESDIFNYLNAFTHGAEAGAAWRFLPNTALVYDANLDFQNYQKDAPSLTRSPVVFADNMRFRTRLGINGALTRNLSLRVLAGYADISFDDGNDGGYLDDHEDVVGEAVLGLGFGPGQSSRLEFGYQRDLVSSALGGWVRLDRGFLTLRSLLGGVFLLSIEGGVAGVEYGRVWGYNGSAAGRTPVHLGANNEDTRHDVRVDGALRGEYRVTNWLAFMADLSVQAVITDFRYNVQYSGAAPIPDPAEYYTIVAFGGVRAHY